MAEHIRGFCNAARTKKDKSVANRRFRKRSTDSERFARELAIGCVFLDLLSFSCGQATQPATQSIVVVDTDFSTPSSMNGLSAKVYNRDGAEVFAKTWKLGRVEAPLHMPASLTLLPAGDDASSTYRIVIEGRQDDQVLVSASRLSGFLAGKTLQLPIALTQNCQNIQCQSGETCQNGRCQDAHLSTAALVPFRALRSPVSEGYPCQLKTVRADLVADTLATRSTPHRDSDGALGCLCIDRNEVMGLITWRTDPAILKKARKAVITLFADLETLNSYTCGSEIDCEPNAGRVHVSNLRVGAFEEATADFKQPAAGLTWDIDVAGAQRGWVLSAIDYKINLTQLVFTILGSSLDQLVIGDTGEISVVLDSNVTNGATLRVFSKDHTLRRDVVPRLEFEYCDN